MPNPIRPTIAAAALVSASALATAGVTCDFNPAGCLNFAELPAQTGQARLLGFGIQCEPTLVWPDCTDFEFNSTGFAINIVNRQTASAPTAYDQLARFRYRDLGRNDDDGLANTSGGIVTDDIIFYDTNNPSATGFIEVRLCVQYEHAESYTGSVIDSTDSNSGFFIQIFNLFNAQTYNLFPDNDTGTLMSDPISVPIGQEVSLAYGVRAGCAMFFDTPNTPTSEDQFCQTTLKSEWCPVPFIIETPGSYSVDSVFLGITDNQYQQVLFDTPCDGDPNDDDVIDVNDISYVLFRLGDPCPQPGCDGDANGDGVVDVNDISYVLFRLGNPC